MADRRVRPAWPEFPPGSRSRGAARAWRAYRDLRSRRVLTLRRLGCALLVLVLLAGAGLLLLGRAADRVASLFEDDVEPVAGSPLDTVAPSTPASSGSKLVDRITARDRLIVAVREAPGLLKRDPATGEYTGFDVALLDLVARDLGVDPARTSFKPLPAGGREAALERGDVDLVVGGYEITDPRRSTVTFAGPYLVSSQRLAVPAGSPVSGLDSLGGGQVCAVEGSAAAGSVAARIGEQLVTRGSLGECVGILSERVVAVAGDEPALEGIEQLSPVGPAVGETRYGIGLPPGDDVLRDRVQSVLRSAVEDGTWARLYAEHLGTPVPAPPPLDP